MIGLTRHYLSLRRLLGPKFHIHLTVHGCGGRLVLLRLPELTDELVQLAETKVAVRNQREIGRAHV